jgi:hypothetical protein
MLLRSLAPCDAASVQELSQRMAVGQSQRLFACLRSSSSEAAQSPSPIAAAPTVVLSPAVRSVIPSRYTPSLTQQLFIGQRCEELFDSRCSCLALHSTHSDQSAGVSSLRTLDLENVTILRKSNYPKRLRSRGARCSGACPWQQMLAKWWLSLTPRPLYDWLPLTLKLLYCIIISTLPAGADGESNSSSAQWLFAEES